MRYRNPAVKIVIDKKSHKLGLGYRRPVFKPSSIGMTVTYWNDKFITAKITALVEPDYGEDKWALLDNGKRIPAYEVEGVY